MDSHEVMTYLQQNNKCNDAISLSFLWTLYLRDKAEIFNKMQQWKQDRNAGTESVTQTILNKKLGKVLVLGNQTILHAMQAIFEFEQTK